MMIPVVASMSLWLWGAVPASAVGDQAGKGDDESGPPGAAVAETVTKYKGDTRRCYEAAVKRGAHVSPDRIQVSLVVERTGDVLSVSTVAPKTLQATEPCIQKAVKAWKFPKAAKKYAVKFPVVVPD
jgi:hypothetical protein